MSLTALPLLTSGKIICLWGGRPSASHSHLGVIMNELWNEYVHVAFDPAHILAELTFTLVFDFLFLALLIPLIKVMLSNFKKSMHKELDEEHGIPPHE